MKNVDLECLTVFKTTAPSAQEELWEQLPVLGDIRIGLIMHPVNVYGRVRAFKIA